VKKNILLFLTLTMALTNNSYSQDDHRLALFFNTAEQMKEVFVLINIRQKQNVPEKREEVESRIKDALDKAEKLQNQNTLCDDGILVYLKGRVDSFQEDIEIEALEKFLSEIKSPMEGESLRIVHDWINEFRERKEPPHYLPLFCLGTIIPIRGNSWSIEYDKMWSTFHFGKGRIPPIPTPELGTPLDLPYQFKTLGLYDKAWRSFVEELGPVYLYDDRKSTEAGVHLREAADCAYRAGEKRLGWNLLMKAAVFGNENTLERVKETATLWLDCEENNKELPAPKLFTIPRFSSRGKIEEYGMKEFEAYLDSIYDRKTTESRIFRIEAETWYNPRLRDAMLRRIGEPGLTEEEIHRECWDYIIGSCVGMRHPRAWALIDEYPEEFENPEELKKKIQDDWLDRVGILIHRGEWMRAKKVEVYGHILLQKEGEDETGKAIYRYPVAPLDVTIPWAFPEGSVEKARQELRTILNEFRQAGEVSP